MPLTKLDSGAEQNNILKHTIIKKNLEPVQFTEQWGRVVKLPC